MSPANMMDQNSFPTVSKPDHDSAFNVLPRPLKRAHTETMAASESSIAPFVKKSTEKSKVRQGSYQDLGLNPQICDAFQAAGYNFPTPIQRKTIPPILSGADVIAMARTGSGKTAAFLAPLLQKLASPLPAASARNNGPRALILSPTRELALQTFKFVRLYTRNAPIRTAIVVGGAPLTAQFESLAVCPPLVVATPGRLLQVLAEMGSASRKALTLSTTEMLVLDEADRLFEGTLAVETAALLAHLRDITTETFTNRQTILVSATMPHALAEFSRTNLRPNLTVVRLDVDKSLPPTLATAFLLSRADMEKDAALQCLLRRLLLKKQSVAIFAATHRRVEYLTLLLRNILAVRVVCVHGNLDQVARVDAVAKFRKGAADVLVVTDVAARGIDLPLLDVVINYDVPQTPKLFIHRVGRVARAGRFGMALSLVAPDELPFMLDTFLFLGRGVSFAQSTQDCNEDPFSSQAYAIESSFLLGSLPKGPIDEEVEMTRNAVEKVDLEKLHSAAKNAHKLYTKTRGAASGESVRRGKTLFQTDDGGRFRVHVHPWFASMESEVEREACHHAALLSAWRPKECMVEAPSSLIKRKRQRAESHDIVANDDTRKVSQPNDGSPPEPAVQAVLRKIRAGGPGAPKRKLSARQMAMEQEREHFFMPAAQESSLRRTEKALKVRSGGSMSDSLHAYKELNDAAADVNADCNADLLRSKHTGGSSGKYWDRVSKKFIKGGVTEATSKKNLHVVSREAKARAKSGETYGTEDGALFKRWLSKNRKNVERLAERVESGETGADLSHLGLQNGLGGNDFRKGAFGRKARIAMATRNKQFHTEKNQTRSGKSELKTVEEIKKVRKLKENADARRQAILNKKRGKANPKKKHEHLRPQRGISKSKVIMRRG